MKGLDDGLSIDGVPREWVRLNMFSETEDRGMMLDRIVDVSSVIIKVRSSRHVLPRTVLGKLG